MCVDKPARLGHSTEPSSEAPRRKRATTERLHVFTPAQAAAITSAVSSPQAQPRAMATSPAEPKRPQVASAVSGDDGRQALEKAKTLPIAEARKSALGLARTQPLSAIPTEKAAAPQPRRVRPVAQLPFKPVVEAKPIAPVAAAVKPIEMKPIVMKPLATRPLVPGPAARVTAPAVTAGILPASKVDEGWSQGRKRSRVEPAAPVRPIKVAEGTQPGVNKTTADRPTVPAIKAMLAERPKLAEGSIAPPPAAASNRPLPSLFSVIDRKPEAAAAGSSSRLPGLPPPAPSRPSIGPKKAVSTVVAAASLGAAPMAIAQARQTGQHALVPQPAQMLLEEEIEEIEEVEPDLPDFVPTASQTAGMIMRARSAPATAPAPLFDAPPRHVAMPPAATSFSAAEAAFFAAGEEMDTIDDSEQETFDDLPGIERPGFWSRLKNRANAGG
jgi:hypothetical protein